MVMNRNRAVALLFLAGLGAVACRHRRTTDDATAKVDPVAMTRASDAERSELRARISERTAAFEARYGAMLNDLVQTSVRNTSANVLWSVLVNEGKDLVGYLPADKVAAWERHLDAMAGLESTIADDVRRYLELRVGRADGDVVSAMMWPYLEKMKIMNRRLVHEAYTAPAGIEAFTAFFTTAKNDLDAYASVVLNKVMPPSEATYRRNVAMIRVAYEGVLPRVEGEVDALADRVAQNLPEGAPTETFRRMRRGASTAWRTGLRSQLAEQLEAMERRRVGGLALDGDRDAGGWDPLAALTFARVSLNIGMFAAVKAPGPDRIKAGYAIARVRKWSGERMVYDCNAQSYEAGISADLSPDAESVPFGFLGGYGFQWDVAKVPYLNLAGLVADLVAGSGADQHASYENTVSAHLLFVGGAGLHLSPFWAPESGVFGLDVEGGIGMRVFAGVGPQVHRNLDCSVRDYWRDHR
jgi:hypothetical protein